MDRDQLEQNIELLGKVIALAFKVGVLTGGAVLLFYCLRIDHFPSSVSVGDGLLFILVAVAFSGIYLFLTVCLTSLGLVLRPLWHFLQWLFITMLKLREKLLNKKSEYEPFNVRKAGYEGAVFAIFGAVFIFVFGLTDKTAVATLLFSAWGCALLWSRRQELADKVRDLEGEDEASKQEKARLRNHQSILLAVIFFIPLLVGGISGKLVDGAMRLVGARAESAIVHVKEPYKTYASLHGLPGKESHFGEDYQALENVVVLFNGFGRDVVLEGTDVDGKRVQLIVPSDHAHIIERQPGGQIKLEK
ncbi:hypothetical protein DOQ08_02403 [Marinobacter litoralis]|uniref:Uncharacterized protein n=1 Tax=Marinobacter litoralis TaxID=187981 RepID=A0A3M2RCC4_9GAMM|nr:hypothetical protein [Marinobacter litoralis]RMJ02938.1 hypothetical protein DOQ08_02403 [Marinobacter litoralis]